MVSIKRNLGLFFIRSLVFVSFMGLCCAAYAAVCTGSQVACCKGTTMSCCPHPGYGSNGVELSYDLSACMIIAPIDPGGSIIIDPDRPIIGPIEAECTSGQKENKYTASGCSYSTSTRTCCSDGTWSPWDASCPTTKTCPTSSKPATRTTCTGGYKTRTVTCNTSTGTWTTGSWGDCDCSDSAYESVPLAGGGRCCQRKDGTGPRCRTGQETLGLRWVAMGHNCNNKMDCGFGCPSNLGEGVACSDEGWYCSKWDSSYTMGGCGGQFESINGRGRCQQFMCRAW